MKAGVVHDLIAANHILHHQNVVDAYGHISIRHPDDPSIFIMSADSAPALVQSPDDLVMYHITDSSPVQPTAKKSYQERFIHSELYKRFPEVNCVIHSHSEAVLPYTMSGVPLKPVFHITGFLGDEVPNFNIYEHYAATDTQNMLVNSSKFGLELARTFASSHSLEHCVVLMANHGFTAVGASIKQAVYRAVYTHKNAGVQSSAMMLRAAHWSSNQNVDNVGLRYLDQKQQLGSMVLNVATEDRPWGLWVREVEGVSLYKNMRRGLPADEVLVDFAHLEVDNP